MAESETGTLRRPGPEIWSCASALGPAGWVWLLITVQIVVWTLVPYIAGHSLPLDVVSDGLAWGHEWQWGYYKHPPLPSWEVEAAFAALGDLGPYLLSQISVGVTYLFVFLLGRELMPARMAAAGTALAACVYFFSLPTPEFNHNVAQMPIWAAASFAYYKSVDTRRLAWWILLGALGGLALLTKYASGVLLAAMWLHLLSSAARRTLLATPGPYLAVAACAAVTAPHLVWLFENHFPTLAYAARRAGQTQGAALRLAAPIRFLATQLLDISPAILVAAIAGFFDRRTLKSIPFDGKLHFLATLGIAPALIAAFISVATAMGLRDMWGAPMWNLSGLLIVYAAQSRWPNVRLAALTTGVAAAFVIFPFCYVVANTLGPELLGKPSRTQWPDRALAAAFAAEFQNRTGQPLHIVAGDGWLAGLIAMRDPARPSVFTDGNMKEAPWITPDRLRRQGAIVVWQADRPMPAGLRRLPDVKVIGTKTFAWPDEPKLPPLAIGWGIVRPGARGTP